MRRAGTRASKGCTCHVLGWPPRAAGGCIFPIATLRALFSCATPTCATTPPRRACNTCVLTQRRCVWRVAESASSRNPAAKRRNRRISGLQHPHPAGRDTHQVARGARGRILRTAPTTPTSGTCGGAAWGVAVCSCAAECVVVSRVASFSPLPRRLGGRRVCAITTPRAGSPRESGCLDVCGCCVVACAVPVAASRVPVHAKLPLRTLVGPHEGRSRGGERGVTTGRWYRSNRAAPYHDTGVLQCAGALSPAWQAIETAREASARAMREVMPSALPPRLRPPPRACVCQSRVNPLTRPLWCLCVCVCRRRGCR